MRFLRRLDRPRRLLLAAAGVLIAGGGLLAGFAPDGRVPVPMAPAGSDGGPALAYVRSLPDAGDAALVRPVGVSVAGGRLYVSDSGDAVVRVFSTGGADMGEIGRGALEVPAYLAYDRFSGTLFVADRQRATVLRFSRGGEAYGDLRPSIETTTPWEPLGVAVDGSGTIAVTESSDRHGVLVMDCAGTVLFSLGSLDSSATPGSVAVALDYPNSVAFSDDEIWVSDSNNRRVLVFDRDGAFKRLIRVGGVARGVTFLTGGPDTLEYVAVADALASDIMLFDTEGTQVARYGGPGSTAGKLAYPNDVAYDPETSQLFVADTGNARVQVWAVSWPDGASADPLNVSRGLVSPMRMFGFALTMMGCVAALVALWPRGREGAEVAIVSNRPERS